MLDFISKDVREYMEQKGIEFTDFEKAALIFHSGLPILEIHRQLEKLADETDDDVLTAASDVYTGRCSLDRFTDCYDTYKKNRLKKFLEERRITVHENC